MPSKSQQQTSLRPRLCALKMGENGYGFHLHGDKGKTGQFIRLVEPGSPAESSGLLTGDRIVFVNGANVENESHQQVVARIRASTEGELELIVVDPETEELLQRHGLKCREEYVREGVPVEVEVVEDEVEADGDGEETGDERFGEESAENGEDGESVKEDEVTDEVEVEVVEEEVKEESFTEVDQEASVTDEVTPEEETQEEAVDEEEVTPSPRQSTPVLVEEEEEQQAHQSNGEVHNHVEVVEEKLSISSEKEESTALRPRLCVVQKGPNGFGFNLHSERARPGQYVRAVDQDSPAERAGLQPQDRVVQVNGAAVEGRTHSQVVSAIKAGGAETRLLVVDPETDAFFKRCRVAPTEEHITGSLPEPVVNGEIEEKVNGKETKEPEVQSKLSISPSPSNASSNNSLTTPPANTPPEGLITDAIPALNLSLQQVKELAHQKRSNKRAPPMDWTKKNELFSNL